MVVVVGGGDGGGGAGGGGRRRRRKEKEKPGYGIKKTEPHTRGEEKKCSKLDFVYF